jgi:uncharacterized protein YkwD
VKTIPGVPLALLSALLCGCLRAPPPSPAEHADPALDEAMSPESFDHALLARAIFEASNRVRAAHGAPALVHVAALDDAADEQATYLALSLTVGHTSPIPRQRNLAERIEGEGLKAASAGENAIMMPARRPTDAPDRDYTYAAYAAYLMEGWMNSPEHRETLLAPRFTELGCAARLAHGLAKGDQRIFATQVFLLPAR